MKICPRCCNRELVEMLDNDPKVTMWICPICTYYESDSEAFALYPWMFKDLGTDILNRIKNQATANGLADTEAQTWFAQEPTFGKPIVSALPDRRKVTGLRNRREGNSAGILCCVA